MDDDRSRRCANRTRLLGVVLQSISTGLKMFIAARFFLGFGVAIAHGSRCAVSRMLVLFNNRQPAAPHGACSSPGSTHFYLHIQYHLVFWINHCGLVNIRHKPNRQQLVMENPIHGAGSSFSPAVDVHLACPRKPPMAYCKGERTRRTQDSR